MNEKESVRSVSIIVPAAGKSARMENAISKQYLMLNGKPLLQHTLATLLSLGARQVVLVVAEGDERVKSLPGQECCTIVMGGDTRSASVLNALRSLTLDESEWVMVHDGARPCLRADDVLRLIEAVGEDDVGGILAVPVVETVKEAGAQERIAGTVARERLWLAQTPQLFRFGLLRQALERAARAGVEVTDESAAVEAMGHSPLLVQGHRDNIKVTTPGDIRLAEYYLRQQGRT